MTSRLPTRCFGVIALFTTLSLLSANEWKHPRLWFSVEELAEYRQRWQEPAFASMLAITAERLKDDVGQPVDDLYDDRIRWQTISWMVSARPEAARRAEELALELIAQPAWTDPAYKGLTRSYGAVSVAQAYDICGSHWQPQTRQRVSDALVQIARDMMRSMGRGGNTRLGNNWQGVRWASSGLALLAADEPGLEEELARCYLKLRQHLAANLDGATWNPEGLGYLIYPLSFTGPFAQAAERAGLGDLRQDEPGLVAGTWLPFHARIPGPARPGSSGFSIDFSDDNPGAGYRGAGAHAFWFNAADETSLAGLRWTYDRWLGDVGPSVHEPWNAALLHTLLRYPAHLPAADPTPSRGLVFHDPIAGVALTRSGWQGEADIVVGLNGPHRRARGGHSGPDTNGIRLIGAGGVFITGGGRTGRSNGTTGLFTEELPGRVDRSAFASLDLKGHSPDGSLVAEMVGSQFGVEDHRRLLAVDFDSDVADAVLIVADHGKGARRWRLATLAANTVSVHGRGFTIRAPSGAVLSATIIHDGLDSTPVIRTEQVPRGTFRDNPALYYHGEPVRENTVIEVQCRDRVIVAMSLQRTGQQAPLIRADLDSQSWRLSVGDANYSIEADSISGGGLPLTSSAKP